MADFKVGDRAKVRLEYDELAKILGRPTLPGTVVGVYGDTVVVAEDSADGEPGGGSSAPYAPYELELI